ncbi:MAG: hypothetical protein DRP02_02285 [Candidatus Gerdarchaeota archaeon]|nr:MAG: hypothetical protein DRP02_02285 [Candidatus Gerdarchaeota archaeon]
MKQKIIKFDKTADFFKLDLEMLKEGIGKALEEFPNGMWELVIRKPTRTPAQRNSIELYCKWLAAKFNDNHVPFVSVYFGKEFEEDWDQELVKEKVFKRALKGKFGKDSTAKATTKEICWVVDYIEKNLALKLGIDLYFPNRMDLLNEQESEEKASQT